MYRVTATVTISEDGWKHSKQIPTFLLDEHVLGICSEAHAAEIATAIINPNSDPHIEVYATCVRI